MKYFTYFLLLLGPMAYGQNSLKVRVIDQETQESLLGATIQLTIEIGAVTDLEGMAEIANIPDGSYMVAASFVGYEKSQQPISIPYAEDLLTIQLVPSHELEEVIVTTTRSSRTIDDIPTRIEAISSEELAEKAVMRSANIAMVLRESTGIQMQLTSASSANQSIRIQGLDGRYTQILKDGFPLFGGFSGGLSIMQIPPLDLKQVEVVKGSNSTLYGGGAIAGLVNLVTLTPEDGRKLRLMLDQTEARGTTFNTFFAQRFNKVGATFYASANRQQSYDPNNDDFSDIPRIRSLTLNPSLFYYFDDQSRLRVTFNATLENRLGGDVQVIEGEPNGIHQFTEENQTERLSYQITYDKNLEGNRRINFRNSLTYFDREIIEPDYVFAGKQLSSFSELSYAFGKDRFNSVVGLNLYTDHFNESPFDSLSRDYNNMTVGLFGQNTLHFAERFALESGLRLDYDTDYGFFPLPRFSFLAKVSNSLSARLGGGLGYKLPTIFTEEAESQTFENILPINEATDEAERSVGGNIDINYKTLLGKDWTLSVNQLFFITELNDALVFGENDLGQFFYENADGPIVSKGIETNLKLGYRDFKLFADYALIDTRLKYDNLNEQKQLTPRHNIGAVLVYEVEDKWRIGYESYYTGRQFRADRSRTDDYWVMGVMALRKINRVSLYINFENITDTRQHKLEDFRVGTHFKPNFPELWAPTDGRIINAGVILDL